MPCSKQALKAFDRSVDANPYAADSYYSRAKVLILMNRLYEAAESLKSSFQLDPAKRSEFEQDFPGAKGMKEFRSLLRR